MFSLGAHAIFVGFVMLRRNWLANSAKKIRPEKVITYGYHVTLNNIMLLSCHRLLFCTGLNIMQVFRFAAECFASGCIKDRIYTVFRRTCALQTPFYLRFT